MAVDSFAVTLENYGADLAAFRAFDEDASELLPYATLLAARNTPDPVLAALAGVYEWQSTPLVFLVDGDILEDDEQLDGIRRRLAMRGDAPYLGVVRPGQLTVYRISLDKDPAASARIKLDISALDERATFPYLANQRPGAAVQPRQWITNVVLRLLDASIERLVVGFQVSRADAISLVGRALFTRFLADRELLPKSLFPGGDSEIGALFDNAESAEATSQWLDRTFNGDFLPMSAGLFESLPPDGFRTLGHILRRAPGGQLHLGWAERWENLDFAQIPVGVLSQAHEHYLRKHDSDKQRKEGGYYTPQIIADMMIRGAFHALDGDGVAHKARILDPAVGAGEFLITGFRQLVAARWRHDRARPQTQTLREILYNQIIGFDVNESALRFAALGLYLASIELDPRPEPVEKLRFEKLRGKVLHNLAADKSDLDCRSLGSLSSLVDDSHVGRYDLVIGNPPWTSGTGLPGWPLVAETVTRIAHTRVPHGIPPKLPNEVLDLPFVWRALEWAKPGGQIAFALHARLLFQQGEGMPQARSSLFSALNVTGIINGAELRQTNVWPQISAPFCVLFSRNELPPTGASFRFVSPRMEDSLNRSGGLRVDASNAERVESQQVSHRPEILKILFRGSQLDLDVYDRLQARKLETLENFWRRRFGVLRGKPQFAGNGYQRLRRSSRPRKKGDGKPGVPASYLWDLPELTPGSIQTILVDASRLTAFRLERIHDPRPREIFLAPLLLVHKSPPAEGGRIRAGVADCDTVFNETYYGYSAKKHSDGRRLVRYLAMLIGSKFALWHALMTSGEFGFEREVIEKLVIDTLPVPSFEDLSPTDRQDIDTLFERVVAENGEAAWSSVDEWAVRLYGLRQQDLQVIEDTLKYGLPFSENRNAAQVPPTPPELAAFCDGLSAELEPWARRGDKHISVRSIELPIQWPWRALQIGIDHDSTNRKLEHDWRELLRIADQMAATEVVLPDSRDGCLWIARLNQARYWSSSQARLLARRLAWEHVDFLMGRKGR